MTGSRCRSANAMINRRRVLINTSDAAIRPAPGSRAKSVTAASISASLCTGDAESSTACDAGGNLLEYLQPFPDQGKIDEGEAGDIAAGTRQGGHETLSYWIVDDAKHDRDGVGRLFQCGNNWRAAADDDVRCRTHHLRRVGFDSAQISTGISMLDLDIAVLGPAEGLEPLAKRNDAG